MKASLLIFSTLLGSSCISAFLIQAVLPGATKPTLNGFIRTTKRSSPTQFATPPDSTGYSPFHASLMKLQNEGIPLLTCDVSKVPNMQAAMWTIMAELSEGDHAQAACVVMEDMPITIIQRFADEFNAWKSIPAAVDHLAELQRFNLSVVGNGAGPAIVIETKPRVPVGTGNERADEVSSVDESTVESITSFFSRMSEMNQMKASEDNNIYRVVGDKDMLNILAFFWASICELDQQHIDGPNKIVLCLSQAISDASKDFDRFLAVGDVLHRTLSMENTNGTYSLSYFHPSYDRESVAPSDDYADGHLLPTEWIRSILQALGKGRQVSAFTDDELSAQNILRRSPVPAVVVSRSETNAKTAIEFQGKKDMVKIPQNVVEEALGTIHMANLGKDELQLALESDSSDKKS